MKVQKQISLKDFTTTEGFVGRYQHLIKDVVIPYQYKESASHQGCGDSVSVQGAL